jgi:hypothetical protein
LVADQAQCRRLDLPGKRPKVGALQSAASGEIALPRRSGEHRADARELGRARSAEVGGKPAFKDGIGDLLDAAAHDLGNALIPGLVGSDFRRGVAKDKRGDAVGVLAINSCAITPPIESPAIAARPTPTLSRRPMRSPA